MAAFEYIAVTPEGKKVSGVEEADGERQVRRVLRDRDLFPMEIREHASQVAGTNSIEQDKVTSRRHVLSYQMLTLVSRQLATLFQAGLPIDEALKVVAGQSKKSTAKKILLSVRSKVLEGHTFADALGLYPRAFPSLYRATVASGEHSGNLGLIMEQLADHTEENSKLRQQVKMALLYPVILMLLSAAITIGLMVYVVPDVISVFTDSGQSLPVLTQLLVSLSDFLMNYGIALLIGFLLILVLAYQLFKLPAVKRASDAMLLGAPISGGLVEDIESARFSATLAILVKSGTPLAEALPIASDVIANSIFKAKMADVGKQVIEGVSLSQALASVDQFPQMMTHMIASGEASGELGVMLGRAATYQSEQLKAMLMTSVKLLEPAVLIIMGGVVLTIVLAILLPILNMNQMVF